MLWLVLPVGCAVVQTEEGRITLWSYDVSTLGRGTAPADMLLGTKACLETSADCTTELSGLSNSGSCAIFDELGTATLAFVGCPESDTIHFEVIAPSEVEARPIDVDRTARENLRIEGELPPSQEEERWRIVADGYVTVFPRLFSEGREVGFRFQDASVSAETWMGAPPQIESDFGSWSEVRVETGALGRLMFNIDRPDPYGLHLPFMKYHGVSPDNAYSMSLSVGYLSGLPYAARAIIYDAEGNQLRGAPVEWTLDSGTLLFGGDSVQLPGPDYIWLSDVCNTQAEPAQRTAVLRATYKWLTATATLQWTNLLSVSSPDDSCVDPSDPPALTERPVPTAQDPTPVGVLAVYPRKPQSSARWSGGCDSAQVSGRAWLTAALVALMLRGRRGDRRSCRR